MRTLSLLVLSAALAACGAVAPPPVGPAAVPTVRLVDSIPWANELGEGVLRRVEVRGGGRVDTVPRVLTDDLPLVTAAGEVLGFAWEEDRIVDGFVYDARTRRTRRLRLPGDFDSVFSAPALAPDGRHLAYAVVPGDGTAWAAVRSWPAGRLVLRSPAVEVPATDSPGNLSRWLSADSAEVFVETGFATGHAWLRVLGSVRAGRVLAADTVRRPPWR